MGDELRVEGKCGQYRRELETREQDSPKLI